MACQPLVAVGDHGAPTIPPPASHDVDGVDGEGIRRADGSADVGVVVEVLDRDVHLASPSVDISNDRFARPVPVRVHDIATVAIAEQLRVVPLITGIRTLPGPMPVAPGVPHSVAPGSGICHGIVSRTIT